MMHAPSKKKQQLLCVVKTLRQLEDNPLVLNLLSRISLGLDMGASMADLEQDIEFTLDAVNEQESGEPSLLGH